MTHDELLAQIDKFEKLDNKSIRYSAAGIKTPITADTPTNKVLSNALRAVVKLHRPEAQEHEQYEKCWNCNLLYPCPTIQAIEEQLK